LFELGDDTDAETDDGFTHDQQSVNEIIHDIMNEIVNNAT
jgi:hypothetical protein